MLTPVLSQAPAYGLTVAQARTFATPHENANVFLFAFLSEGQDISYLPTWVKIPKQITDGHVVELARAKGAVLATLDGKIPGAYLIPKI